LRPSLGLPADPTPLAYSAKMQNPPPQFEGLMGPLPPSGHTTGAKANQFLSDDPPMTPPAHGSFPPFCPAFSPPPPMLAGLYRCWRNSYTVVFSRNPFPFSSFFFGSPFSPGPGMLSTTSVKPPPQARLGHWDDRLSFFVFPFVTKAPYNFDLRASTLRTIPKSTNSFHSPRPSVVGPLAGRVAVPVFFF